MRYLINIEVRRNAGVHHENVYIFAITENSRGHASGWHSIDDIFWGFNATRIRHCVASLLAHSKLSKKEKEMVY